MPQYYRVEYVTGRGGEYIGPLVPSLKAAQNMAQEHWRELNAEEGKRTTQLSWRDSSETVIYAAPYDEQHYYVHSQYVSEEDTSAKTFYTVEYVTERGSMFLDNSYASVDEAKQAAQEDWTENQMQHYCDGNVDKELEWGPSSDGITQGSGNGRASEYIINEGEVELDDEGDEESSDSEADDPAAVQKFLEGYAVRRKDIPDADGMDAYLYETYGDDLKAVRAWHDRGSPVATLTEELTEEGTTLFIQPNFHRVNRLGYVLLHTPLKKNIILRRETNTVKVTVTFTYSFDLTAEQRQRLSNMLTEATNDALARAHDMGLSPDDFEYRSGDPDLCGWTVTPEA